MASNNLLKKMGLSFVIFIVCLVSLIAEAEVVQITAETCGKQIGSPQENSPYEIYVFCEGALGRYIGIMRKGQIGATPGGWTFTSRFWQEATWSTDVWSIAWVDNGESLLVSNSEIYGEGEIFLLDLEARSSRTLFSYPTKSGRVLTIDHVDESKRQVLLNVEEAGKIRKQTVDF